MKRNKRALIYIDHDFTSSLPIMETDECVETPEEETPEVEEVKKCVKTIWCQCDHCYLVSKPKHATPNQKLELHPASEKVCTTYDPFSPTGKKSDIVW